MKHATEFVLEMMRYLLQTKEGKKLIPIIEDKVFQERRDDAFLIGLAKAYLVKYHVQPTQVTLEEFFRQSISKRKQLADDPDLRRDIADRIREYFIPLGVDRGITRDMVLKYAKEALMQNLMVDNADKVQDADEGFYSGLYREMSNIVTLGDDLDDGNAFRGGALFKDHKKRRLKRNIGAPCKFEGLNALTAARGFHSPQHIVFMGGPKSFKTGTIINIGIQYAIDGLKVYYADGENGENSIWMRAQQCLLSCTRDELFEDDAVRDLDLMMPRLQAMGGDFRTDFYATGQKNIGDVEARLREISDDHLAETGEPWVPDLIIYDYPDLFNARNPGIRDKRLAIQSVYHDITALNNRLGCFAISISQVRKEAVEAEIIKVTDFNEDFGKGMNAHAAFALCRTPEEMAKGFLRIIPVVQREGTVHQGSKTTVLIKVDPERMSMVETGFTVAIEKGKGRDAKETRTYVPLENKNWRRVVEPRSETVDDV